MAKRKSVLEGLKVTVTFSDPGSHPPGKHKVVIPAINVAALRSKTGLSQQEFAESIGVSKATLQNWEQGRRNPSGPAQVLLAIIGKKPSLVKDLFANRHIYQPQPVPFWTEGGLHPDRMTPGARWAEIFQILKVARARVKAKSNGARAR